MEEFYGKNYGTFDNFILGCGIVFSLISGMFLLSDTADNSISTIIKIIKYGVFIWYWNKDKDYKGNYLAFFILAVLGYEFAMAFLLLASATSLDGIIAMGVMILIINPFAHSYLYQLFKIKSYNEQERKRKDAENAEN